MKCEQTDKTLKRSLLESTMTSQKNQQGGNKSHVIKTITEHRRKKKQKNGNSSMKS